MKIKDIPSENRPRERLQKLGVNVLSDAELLAVIFQKGTKEENVIDMSNKLISKYGLNKLSDLSLNELQEIKGIGPAKAMQLKALFEFNKRYNLSKIDSNIIKSAKDIFDYALQMLPSNDKEHLMVIYLDSRNKIIKSEVVSIGTLNSSLIHPREVFKQAIKESANSIILVHNHPSGDVNPSQRDIEATKRLNEAGDLLGINVLDHVIVGKDKFFNFKDNKVYSVTN